jgi:uncharacterized repeat protein (TIGR03803 family)
MERFRSLDCCWTKQVTSMARQWRAAALTAKTRAVPLPGAERCSSSAARESSQCCISFTGATDGNGPNGSLIQDPEGNLYGTTETGTTNSFYGTVFKLNKAGSMIVLHQLNGNSDGATPLGGLIRDSAGTLYGTAFTNFTLFNINGTVFKVTP